MIKTFVKQLLAITLSFLLIINAVPSEAGGQEPTATGSTGYSGQGAPLSADELQQLATPIALYPDALVATALTKAVDSRTWDPSVKALTQFPSVLDKPGEEPQLDLLIRGGIPHATF